MIGNREREGNALTIYEVRAKRWAHGWELHIRDVGVTQSHSLRDAERMVRDFISLDTGLAPDAFDVEITPEIGGGVEVRAANARRAVAAAEETRRSAAAEQRAAARDLAAAGLPGRDIAVVLGVSAQRVSQLLKDPGAGDRGEGPRYATG
jgi:hypothetical protein